MEHFQNYDMQIFMLAITSDSLHSQKKKQKLTHIGAPLTFYKKI